MFVEDWTKWLRLLLIFMPFCILTALMRDVDILHIFCVLLLLLCEAGLSSADCVSE